MYDLKQLYKNCREISNVCEMVIGAGRDFLELEIPRTSEALVEYRFFPLPCIEQVLDLYSGTKNLNLPYGEYDDLENEAVEIIGRMTALTMLYTDLKKEITTYGCIPEEYIVHQIKSDAYLSLRYLETLHGKFYNLINCKTWTQFQSLTDFIPEVEQATNFAHGVFDTNFDLVVKVFHAVSALIDNTPEYAHIPDEYPQLLEERGLQWSNKSMLEADESVLDDIGILALFAGISRAEDFDNGTIDRFFSKGCILRCLKRLKQLDDLTEDEDIAEQLPDDDQIKPSDNEDFCTLIEIIKDGIARICKQGIHELPEMFPECLFADLDRFLNGEEMNYYDISLSLRVDNELSYISIHCEEESIEISKGGSVYDEAVGSDSYTSWMYTIWRDGDSDSYLDYTMIEDLREFLYMEGIKVSIEVD